MFRLGWGFLGEGGEDKSSFIYSFASAERQSWPIVLSGREMATIKFEGAYAVTSGNIF